MRNIGLLVLASASLGLAQHSLTITASRSSPAQPDQVVIGVNVNSGMTTGLDDVLAALQGSGLTAANLSSVYTQTVYVGSQTQQALQWTFSLSIPFSQMKDTLASLASLQKKLGQKGNGLTMAFAVQSTQVSPQLLASQQCPIPGLLADARTQAQKLADAAGFFLGPVTALSSGGFVTGTIPTAVSRVGTFGGIAVVPYASFLLGSVQSGPNCSATVTFRLN
jgi:hypothetical protein